MSEYKITLSLVLLALAKFRFERNLFIVYSRWVVHAARYNNIRIFDLQLCFTAQTIYCVVVSIQTAHILLTTRNLKFTTNMCLQIV